MEMQPRNIFITGGAGFIGSAITNALVRQGHKVSVFDDFSRGDNQRLIDSENIELLSGDIRNSKSLFSAYSGQSSLIHLAYINGTKHFYSIPEEVLDVGISGMQNICKLIPNSQITEFYLASSSEVYQQPDHFPTSENVSLLVPDPTNPRYSYGLGKIVQEFMTWHSLPKQVSKKIIFRPHNVYGPNMGFDHVIPELFQKIYMKNVNTIEVLGDGKQTRSFCHITDFVSAFLKLFKGADSGTFNIGSPEEIDIYSLAKLIARIAGKDIGLVTKSSPRGETQRRLPDISKLQKLGFKPQMNLELGLIAYKEWFERYLSERHPHEDLI